MEMGSKLKLKVTYYRCFMSNVWVLCCDLCYLTVEHGQKKVKYGYFKVKDPSVTDCGDDRTSTEYSSTEQL